MNLFDVYPLYDLNIVKGQGCWVWDDKGQKYLDLYGGHAVISIGHSHPEYIARITEQVKRLGFYSNAVHNSIQEALAEKLGQISGYSGYNLFLCNSGAEAVENALKLASFHTNKKKVIAFRNSFHGRTSAALSVTDNTNISAPINKSDNVLFIELNDHDQFEEAISQENICGCIIEGIQGVGGLNMPNKDFLQRMELSCKKHNVMLILDEVQSGYGRSGKFFAHQWAGIKPDLITVGKGMGNGFPLAGVLISPEIKAKHGMLGTTFGGNHLACVAGLAVLEILEQSQLMDNVNRVSEFLINELAGMEGVTRVKGKGLMIGPEFDFPVKPLLHSLLYDHHIFTGSSADPNVLRILPPLNITLEEIQLLLPALKKSVAEYKPKV